MPDYFVHGNILFLIHVVPSEGVLCLLSHHVVQQYINLFCKCLFYNLINCNGTSVCAHIASHFK